MTNTRRVTTLDPALRAEAEDIVQRWINPPVKNTLRALYGAPLAVIYSTLQLLDFGSRAAMRQLKMTVPPADVSDEGRSEREIERDLVELTDLGWAVMVVLHGQEEADPKLSELAAMVRGRVSNQ